MNALSHGTVIDPDSHPTHVRTLIAGSMAGLGASFSLGVLELVRTIVLARLLLPEEFGVFALAVVFAGILAILRNWGFDSALIQKSGEDARPEIHFTLNMAAGLVLLPAAAGCAWLLDTWYPSLASLPLLFLFFVGIEWLSALPATSLAMLNKSMAFRRLAVIDIWGAGLGTVVAIGMAASGLGPFSLLGIPAGTGMARWLGALMGGHRIWYRLTWDRTTIMDYVRFSRPILMTKGLRQLLNRFDQFWIGTFGSAVLLGFYSKAWGLHQRGSAVLSRPIDVTFLPVWSRMKDRTDQLGRSVEEAIGMSIRLLLPVFVVFVWAAPEMIPVILGPNWHPMIPIFQVLSPVMLFGVVSRLLIASLTARDEHHRVPWIRLSQLAMVVPLTILGLSFLGPIGVATGAMVASAWAVWRLVVLSTVHVSWRPWNSVKRPLLIAILLVASLGGLPVPMWPASFVLAYKAGTAVLAWTLLSFILDRSAWQHAVRLLRDHWNEPDYSSQ